ncbi:MAG: exodeoxyribonuclease V subunit gamma [Thermodesulfobacteriota bacterium]|nr:exodeoxyribonuclease V subunit gamma [Thermodesulfobacteriota bacterium]
MPIKLFTSNRMEVLADALARELRHPKASPLAEEIILVQSVGMKRWLSMAIARANTVCANTRFLFPNAFLYEYLGNAFPEAMSDLATFDVETMTWRIMAILRETTPTGPFALLAAYMKDDGEGLKRYQLAARIADTFDQYLVFRPEMIFQWESGAVPEDPQAAWQARLWKTLTGDGHQVHRAGIWRRFLEAVEKGETDVAVFPERVSVFGISTLPEFHLHMLSAISRYATVNLFLLNPCREYWGDIPSGREVRRAEHVAADRNIDQSDLHLEANSLLGAMGMVGRDFFDMLTEYDCEENSRFVDPGRETLLTAIQQDILALQSVETHGPQKTMEFEAFPETCKPGFGSVMINACHGPMREVQVLYDNLLAMFEADPSLRPEDILVMAPDIETYSPYIQAVFEPAAGAGGRSAPMIPYTIADRSPRAVSLMAETVVRFFDFFDSRFIVTDVLDMLEPAFIRRRFDISAADLAVMTRWIDAVNIRWGIDGAFKRDMGLPGFDENTWTAGINSMMLGYAMAGEGAGLFAGMLPCDQIDAGDADVLEKLIVFWQTLMAFKDKFHQQHTAAQWRDLLVSLLDTFVLADSDTQADVQMLMDVFNRLNTRCWEPGFDESISPAVIRAWLMSHLEKHGAGTPFLSAGATFCSLLPMRSIPFPVICLLGMNVDDYPRHVTPPGFDLISKAPKRGDRSRRNDDRYLFLETLLSVRKRFYISYTGSDIQDNSPAPPSVLVSELMDYLNDRFYVKTSGDITAYIRTDHRLQPFHPDYFTGDRLFGYDADFCETAKRLIAPDKVPPVFDEGISATPGNIVEEEHTLTLADLAAFFTHPVRYFFNKRLGIYLPGDAPVHGEDEPFQISGLEQYAINQIIVHRIFDAQKKASIYDHLRAAGRLPHGEAGRTSFERLYDRAYGFVTQLNDYTGGRQPATIAIDLALDNIRICGQVDNVYGDTWLQYRYADVKARDRLQQWIVHLVLNCGARDDGPVHSVFAGKDMWLTCNPVDNGEAILKQLLHCYRTGMTRLLHFFPESAFVYADTLARDKPVQAAFSKAIQKWQGNANYRGEGADEYYLLGFGKTVPLDGEFKELAEIIYNPLFKSVSENKFDNRLGMSVNISI